MSNQIVTESVSKKEINGIGFDATCSLVVLNKDFQPVAVNDDSKIKGNLFFILVCKNADLLKKFTALLELTLILILTNSNSIPRTLNCNSS